MGMKLMTYISKNWDNILQMDPRILMILLVDVTCASHVLYASKMSRMKSHPRNKPNLCPLKAFIFIIIFITTIFFNRPCMNLHFVLVI